MQAATKDLERILICSRIGNAFAFTYMPNGVVLNEKIVAFSLGGHTPFTLIQCRVHEIWTRFFGSTLKDDLQYTPSDCFETFPFPDGLPAGVGQDSDPDPSSGQDRNPDPRIQTLEAAGKAYYEFRAALMVRNNEGLTKTYNRFHDPNERSPDIQRLRELHAAMDRTVFDAYGGDLAKLSVPSCEFLLDFEDEEDEDEPTTGRQRKKPWRYRWPDAFRDEVLALLLELNKQRAEQERLVGPGDGGKGRKGPARRPPQR